MTAATIEVLRAISLRLTSAAWHEAFDGLPVAGSLLECILNQGRQHLVLLELFAEKRHLPQPSSLPSLATNDSRLLLATQTEMQTAYKLAGLSCWGSALATEVDGARLRTLHANFGPEALLHAQRWQQVTRQTILPIDLKDILDAVESAGRACMRAWLATLPEAWRAWLTAVHPAWAGADDLPVGMESHGIAIWRDAMGAAQHGS